MALSVSSYLSSVSSSSSGYGFSSESRATPTFKLFRPSSLLVNTFPRRVTPRGSYLKNFSFSKSSSDSSRSRTTFSIVPRSSGSSSSGGSEDEPKDSDKTKVEFGYSRKDVLLIGVGVTLLGVGLKSGLEFAGVDPLQAGNVVQLVLVLGLTLGWISTYIFRVSNKEMTYVQQLRDYEDKVMEKRIEGLTEAELVVLLEQVEEEKQQRLAKGKKV
ncbi:uncharacterized protein LOC113320415 [Papaver somniferum]|uniref:uncharacterized protein LOC113320415 n=1 Tax=Papaver somniferum TaxID=3469 RepID=UPI000E6FAAEE|nr:uncharacterized protein LOC113320415 [Papaver somniferum]